MSYCNRNAVEDFSHELRRWRGLIIRWDKLQIVYRAAAVLNAVIRWLAQLRDTP